MKQLYKKHKQLIPLIILSFFTIWILIRFIENTLSRDTDTYFILNRNNYYALIAIALGYISYYLIRKAYKYILIGMMVLGLFNIINFTVFEMSTTLSFNSHSIIFQPLSLAVGLITLAINLDKVGDLLSVSEEKQE